MRPKYTCQLCGEPLLTGHDLTYHVCGRSAHPTLLQLIDAYLASHRIAISEYDYDHLIVQVGAALHWYPTSAPINEIREWLADARPIVDDGEVDLINNILAEATKGM